MSAFNLRELRNAFGTFMTGVTVVTAVGSNQNPVGFTANSFTPVSLDPPLILVCPARTLSSFEVFNNCGNFAVNILAEDQQDISNVFAVVNNDRFAGISWRADDADCPLIRGAAASFSCAALDRVAAGDHLILIGEIEHFETNGKAGLGFSNSGYFSLGLERKAADLPRPARPVSVGAIIEHEGRVLMVDTPEGLRPPSVKATSRTGSLAAIEHYLLDAGIQVDFGPVYSVYENKVTGESSTYYRGVAADHKSAQLGPFISIDELSSLRFASSALTDMMQRYVLERQNGVFCLYVGDEVEGDVHMFGQGLQS